ncbi:hypothetical protein CORC01_12453 [Colletotrichum orchidophilum]|uniref:N-acetyltransferase domain-containing protein n=1 Tax=Colletotrichum orchidophilum TaxID=1209926 RepID=A0A1G4ASS8_9PEZI|nr:uncharacterized protein CORC01_12453 [Colletotrichum orchidophilum]OHE92217.1 hypothetical protein CORC01_12453 [Colletotrichum orchidophilum]
MLGTASVEFEKAWRGCVLWSNEEDLSRDDLLLNISTIHSFIVAATAEQLPGATIGATPESLAATLHFEPSSSPEISKTLAASSMRRFAYPLLARTPDGAIAGLAIYFYNYSTWSAAPGLCLEEFYVLPEFRSLGYGRILMKAMAQEARDAGCVKMEWVCLENNERALRFYGKLGAKRMEDWVVLKLTQEVIATLAEEM